jgi:hypothetical protein
MLKLSNVSAGCIGAMSRAIVFSSLIQTLHLIGKMTVLLQAVHIPNRFLDTLFVQMQPIRFSHGRTDLNFLEIRRKRITTVLCSVVSSTNVSDS